MKRNIFVEMNEILDKIDSIGLYQVEINKLQYKLVLQEMLHKEELRIQKDIIEKTKWGHELWIGLINSF